jgi:EF hand.
MKTSRSLSDFHNFNRQNLLKAADTDKNGSIDFKEFCGLFSDVEQYNAINELSNNKQEKF